MKLLPIAVLLALAGCKQKPAPGLTFNSTTMPLKIEEVPETVKSATAPALAAAICDQGTGCIYTSAAGKEWHNDGKHWYKRGDHSREVQGDAHASSFGGDSRFTFDPQPSGEVKFGPVIATLDWSEPTAITTKDWTISVPLSGKPPTPCPPDALVCANKDSIWNRTLEADAKWTFRIDGQEYTLTGKELAYAVKSAKVEELPGICDSERGCLVTTRRDGLLEPVYSDKYGETPLPNPFYVHAGPDHRWKVFMKKPVEVTVVPMVSGGSH